MPRRRLLIAVAAAVAVAVAVVVVVLSRGGDEGTKTVGDPLGEALAHAPTSAPVVGVVRTSGDQADALDKLADEFPIARIARGQAQTVLGDLSGLPGGNPVVVWGRALALDGIAASFVAGDEDRLQQTLDNLPKQGDLYRSGDFYVGVEGPVVVAAGNAADVRAAMERSDRGAGMTRAVLASRLGPLRRDDALVQLVGLPRVITGGRGAGTPFGDALRSLAVTVRVADPGLRFRVHLATTPVPPQDLPLAPGPQPPSPAAGDAPSEIAVRGMSQTLDVLNASRGRIGIPAIAGLEDALATVDRVRGPLKTFGRIDVDAALLDQVTGTTTITREAAGGLAVRAELRDGDPLRTALGRIAAVPEFALEAAGAGDFDLDRRGDAFTYVTGDGTLVRLAVLGDTFVATSDPRAGLRRIANRRPARSRTVGALQGRLTGRAVQDLVMQQLSLPGAARLILGGLGALSFAARAEPTAIDGEGALELRP